ncbi:MAG: EAL domain-containing protein [Aliidiomarina sp.]|uniref:bifunctional diguanylate cyclase/phosphodiesterase n=1 Tax=Aliidiomarina sp. TaxID=1872439 RepID=UPI0025C1780E|nr:EAL domain-containing protein [Aliidiomarina sp.]MCH8500794.1 EAL domain-containing protein [Aliidiomarina sp.]
MNMSSERVLQLIGEHADLDVLLEAITDWVEQQIPAALISIMHFDAAHQTLSMHPSSQFSTHYNETLQDLVIGPKVGSCGVAAFSRELVITENIFNDPNWDGYYDLAREENIAACWSIPVVTVDNELYGTFATYYREPRSPSKVEISVLRRAASMVALALAHYQERRLRIGTDQRYESLFHHHPDAVFEMDLDGYLTTINPAGSAITGFSVEQVQGQHYNAFVTEAFRELADRSFALAKEGKPQHYEITVYHASGKVYWLEITNLPIYVEGELVGVFGIGQDITEKHELVERLRLLNRGIESSPHGVVMSDARKTNMPIVYANPAFLKITGYAADEIIGQNCRMLQGADTTPEAVHALREGIRRQREVEVTLLNYRKDGTPFWNHLIISPVFDHNGLCTHYIGIQQDVTQQRQQEAQLAAQRNHDHLTGLYNRQAFEEELWRYNRVPTTGLAVVMYIDLDDFSSLNQSLGHEVGDQLLIEVSHRMKTIFGEQGIVARVAADEFAVLMPNVDNKAEAVDVAETLLNVLAQPIAVSEHRLHVSASIGLCERKPKATSALDALQHAISAMNEAKRQGRNTWCWSDESDDSLTTEYANLRREIMEAIEQEQFTLFYQPLLQSKDNKVVEVEALIRWRHPERGIVPPGLFIALAEKTGQIVTIGSWVLRQACFDIATWNQQHQQSLRVAVNISPLQFRRTGFVDEVKSVLKASQLPPQLLELEVTESVLLLGADRTIAIMDELRSLGIQVAIDDFGTGYSSLSYLRSLPVNKIKLDRSFIQNLPDNQGDVAIVQGLITMAHLLHLQIVAEGVETAEQVEFLGAQHCDLLQGFYFAKPAPLHELVLPT